MAWRIEQHVIRGEIDNRVLGEVSGRIWFKGVDQPVELRLKGNAHADLAGCLLKFRNAREPVAFENPDGFQIRQNGTVGDITASRKVRVPDVPIEEFLALRKAGKPAPEHMGNCLYLEWFSRSNGRVVIEGVDWPTEISPPEWTWTEADERRRQEDASLGYSGFIERIDRALEDGQDEVSEDPDWDEHDYEAFLKESDERTEKYRELLDKYGTSPEAQEQINREMGWTDDADDEGDEPEDEFVTAMDEDELNQLLEETSDMGMEPDPATEGVDWIRVEGDESGTGAGRGDIRHPLYHRCFESAMWLWQELQDLGLGDEEGDLEELAGEFQMTGTKLAGALNHLAFGRDAANPAFTVAWLKRALSHIHGAQSALVRVAAADQLPEETLARLREELFAIREEILKLMDEFRGRK